MESTSMNDFLQKNAMTLIIAGMTVISSYAVNTALYGYRLQSIEERVERQGTAITDIRNNNTDIQISLARLQVDIAYIKVQLDKIVP